MEREEDRRDEGIHLFRIQIAEKRERRGACERQSQEGGGGDKAGMGDRQKEVHERVVMEFGVEVYGWREGREIEVMQERWIRWTLGVD